MSARVRSVQNLLLEALEISSPLDRARFLAEACGTDLTLRVEVEELIRAAGESGGFLPPGPVGGASGMGLGKRITPDGNNP
jgi:hypothetical protein